MAGTIVHKCDVRVDLVLQQFQVLALLGFITPGKVVRNTEYNLVAAPHIDGSDFCYGHACS